MCVIEFEILLHLICCKFIFACLLSPNNMTKRYDWYVRSSMTLFDAVSPDDVFSEVLAAFYDSKRDRLTLDIISSCLSICHFLRTQGVVGGES